jgi:hypothetical protein
VLDVEQLVAEFSKLPAQSLKDIFGLQRVGPGAALTAPDAVKKLREHRESVANRAPNFEAEAAAAKLDPTSFAFQLDKMAASWERLRNAIADAGALDAVASGMERLAAAVKSMSDFFSMFNKDASRDPTDGMNARERGGSMWRRPFLNALSML